MAQQEIPSIITPLPVPFYRRFKWRAPLMIALGCFIVSVILFCPRYYLWSPMVWDSNIAESNRAMLVGLQLHDPFMPLPLDRHLEWRILFPFIGHVFSMPLWLLLALAHVSSLALLIYVAMLTYGRTKSAAATFAATAVTATCSAYLTSVHFLGYYDSAMMLLLLMACFEKRTIIVWAAATLGPWIDERFIIVAPLAMWCQWRQRRQKLILPLLLGIAPYLALRAFAFFTHSDTSKGYLQCILSSKHDPFRLFLGLTNALRWGWLLAIPACMGLKPLGKVLAILLILATAGVLLFISGDYSRSVAAILPLAIWGFLSASKIQNARRWLTALAIVTLVTPVYFSFRAFHVRIKPIWEQLVDARGFNRILDTRISKIRDRALWKKESK